MGPAIRANNCHAGSTLDSAEIENPIVRLKFDSFYARQRSDKPDSAFVAALNSGFEEEEIAFPNSSTDHMQTGGLVARCVGHVCIHLG